MERFRFYTPKVDNGEMSVKEFIILVWGKGKQLTDEDIQSAYEIYKKFGGQKYSLEDFKKAVEG